MTENSVEVRVDDRILNIDQDGYRWARRTSPKELFEIGDLIEVTLIDLPNNNQEHGKATLDQEPEVEASLVAIDNRTGHVLAMVGGYDFQRSKFNRATQAFRQLGSLFKGVLYAAAVDQGYTTTTILEDKPASFEAGPNQEPYRPTNYDNEYEGPITLRWALEDSRNVPAVWLMNEIGPDTVVEFGRRVGFSSPIPPYLSVALGAAEQRGTAQRARRELNWPVGGKTGTMDEYTDAWFVGFDPDITVGVWVGYDEKKTMGDNEQGARVALPIWIDFMKAYIGNRQTPPGFIPPGNIAHSFEFDSRKQCPFFLRRFAQVDLVVPEAVDHTVSTLKHS